MTSPRVLSIPTPRSVLSRLLERIEPERFTKRGIVRIQMWGFVAAIFVTYPTYVIASDGWAGAFQQPGVLVSAFGAACAAFVAIKTAFSFLENSAKRAEKRASQAVAPHDHPEEFRLLRDVAGRIDRTDRRISDLARVQEEGMNEVRDGQRHAMEARIKQQATLDQIKAASDIQSQQLTTIITALAMRTKE